MRFTTTTVATTIGTLALTIASCGGSADPAATDSVSSAPPATEAAVPSQTDGAETPGDVATVGILNSRFDPLEATVAIGGTVTFTNNDPFAHTVTSKDDAAMSFTSDLEQDDTFDVQFDQAGTFAYFCEIHPTMRATVVVG